MKKYPKGKHPNSRNGFPPREIEGIKTLLVLSEDARSQLKVIGGGNMSKGVEKLLEIKNASKNKGVAHLKSMND